MIITEELITRAIATLKQYQQAVKKGEKCLINWNAYKPVSTVDRYLIAVERGRGIDYYAPASSKFK